MPVWREKAAWIPPPNGEIPAMPGGQKAHLKRIANPRLPYVVKPGFLGKTHQSHTAQLSNNYHLNSKSSLLKSSLSGAGKEAVILITVLHQFLKGTQIYYIVPSFLASIQDTWNVPVNFIIQSSGCVFYYCNYSRYVATVIKFAVFTSHTHQWLRMINSVWGEGPDEQRHAGICSAAQGKH